MNNYTKRTIAEAYNSAGRGQASVDDVMRLVIAQWFQDLYRAVTSGRIKLPDGEPAEVRAALEKAAEGMGIYIDLTAAQLVEYMKEKGWKFQPFEWRDLGNGYEIHTKSFAVRRKDY